MSENQPKKSLEMTSWAHPTETARDPQRKQLSDKINEALEDLERQNPYYSIADIKKTLEANGAFLGEAERMEGQHHDWAGSVKDNQPSSMVPVYVGTPGDKDSYLIAYLGLKRP